MAQTVRSRLAELSQAGGSSREMQDRRDALMDFEQKGLGWAQATIQAWHKALVPAAATARVNFQPGSLELIGDEVVERKILSSRLAQAIQEKASWELNDLRVRMQYLEGDEELARADVLQPEALMQMLVEQWDRAELSHEAWLLVQDVIQRGVLGHVPEAYRLTNEFLVKNGVLRDIDLSSRVKRGTSARKGRKSDTGPGQQAGGMEPAGVERDQHRRQGLADPDAARIPTRHHELGKRSDDETDNDGDQDVHD